MFVFQNILVKLTTIASSFKPLKRGFSFEGQAKRNNSVRPPASAKAYKGPFLKGRGVLRNNRKANVEKWELRRLENLIESVRIVLNAIPRREHENKGRQRGVSAEVKLCQPELRSDERTGVDLCTKCKRAPACLKSPLSFQFLDVIISPVGHVPIADSLLVWRHYFFTATHRWKRPPNRLHLWNGTFVIRQQIRPFIKSEQWQEFQCLEYNFQRPVSVKEHRHKWSSFVYVIQKGTLRLDVL